MNDDEYENEMIMIVIIMLMMVINQHEIQIRAMIETMTIVRIDEHGVS